VVQTPCLFSCMLSGGTGEDKREVEQLNREASLLLSGGRVLWVCSVKRLHPYVTRRSFFPFLYISNLTRDNPTLLGGVRSSQGQPFGGI